jgi:hypothetical protein
MDLFRPLYADRAFVTVTELNMQQRYKFVSTIISGAMKLESTTFRPREVVNHALQTAAASLKKELTLEGCIGSDVPVEVNRKNDVYTFCNLRTWMTAMIMLIS